MCPILDNKLQFHSIYDGLPPSVGTRLEKGVQWIWNWETEEIPQTIFQREKKKVEILEQPAQTHTASEGQSGVECRQCESSWIAEAKPVTIVAGGTWHAENIYLEEN